MKLNNKYTKRKAGMTLLELTVVILVLLSLITILFIGARAWKRGADRSANILNIRNVQQAARGHANMRNLEIGDTLPESAIHSSDGVTGYMKTPSAPADLDDYVFGSTVPAIGALYTANNADHVVYGFDDPSDYEDW